MTGAAYPYQLAPSDAFLYQRIGRHSCNIVLDSLGVDLYGSPMHNNALTADVQTAAVQTADLQTGYPNR